MERDEDVEYRPRNWCIGRLEVARLPVSLFAATEQRPPTSQAVVVIRVILVLDAGRGAQYRIGRRARQRVQGELC